MDGLLSRTDGGVVTSRGAVTICARKHVPDIDRVTWEVDAGIEELICGRVDGGIDGLQCVSWARLLVLNLDLLIVVVSMISLQRKKGSGVTDAAVVLICKLTKKASRTQTHLCVMLSVYPWLWWPSCSAAHWEKQHLNRWNQQDIFICIQSYSSGRTNVPVKLFILFREMSLIISIIITGSVSWVNMKFQKYNYKPVKGKKRKVHIQECLCSMWGFCIAHLVSREICVWPLGLQSQLPV